MEREKCKPISAGRQLTGENNTDSSSIAAFFLSTMIVLYKHEKFMASIFYFIPKMFDYSNEKRP